MIMKMTMNKMLKAAAKVATKMCDPDLYTFQVEYFGEGQVVVNCYGNSVPFGDCSGYAYDLGIVVEEILNANFPIPGKTWTLYSEENYLDADGVEISQSEYASCKGGACVQFVIFSEEN